MYCFPFLRWIIFCSGCFRQIFFHLGDKKVVADCVRQVVVLYSDDCMGICLVGLSIGRLRQVVILQRWSVKITFYRVFSIAFIQLFFLLVFQFLCFQSTGKRDLCFQNIINWNNVGYQANFEPIKQNLSVCYKMEQSVLY